MTVNLHILLKMHPDTYRYKLELIPMVLRFAVSRSYDVCLFVCVQRNIEVNDS
jgi:hypothetical protein